MKASPSGSSSSNNNVAYAQYIFRLFPFPPPHNALSVLLLSEGNVAYCLHNGRSLALCVCVCECVRLCVCVSLIERTRSRRCKAAFTRCHSSLNQYKCVFNLFYLKFSLSSPPSATPPFSCLAPARLLQHTFVLSVLMV